MRRSAAILAAAAILAGCATTTGTAPREARSGFDGARVVSISPHGAACKTIICPAIGAEWNGKRPNEALLDVTIVNAYTGINALQINIDGEILRLAPLPGVTSLRHAGHMRESSRVFVTSLGTVRRMASAKRVWIRVGTLDGAIEEAIIDGATDSKALHALRRFLERVDAGGG